MWLRLSAAMALLVLAGGCSSSSDSSRGPRGPWSSEGRRHDERRPRPRRSARLGTRSAASSAPLELGPLGGSPRGPRPVPQGRPPQRPRRTRRSGAGGLPGARAAPARVGRGAGAVPGPRRTVARPRPDRPRPARALVARRRLSRGRSPLDRRAHLGRADEGRGRPRGPHHRRAPPRRLPTDEPGRAPRRLGAWHERRVGGCLQS